MNVAPTFIPTPTYGHPVELALIERLKLRGEELVELYLASNLRDDVHFVSRDSAKRLFLEFKENPTVNNRYTDAAASAIADSARRTLLGQSIRSGRNQIVVLTGCPASGKTGSAGPRQDIFVKIQHETILSSLPRGIQLLEEAMSANLLPTVRLFYTDDPKINVERMIKRALRIGRTVPLKYMAETYLSVPAIVMRLHEHFGKSICVRVTNNSEMPEEAVHHHRIDRALYHVGRYTVASALEAMHARLDEIAARSDGIPEDILREARRE